MSGYYRQLTKILRDHGCSRVDGGKGSHEKWFSPVNGRTATVPPKTKSRHTVNAILAQLGIAVKIP